MSPAAGEQFAIRDLDGSELVRLRVPAGDWTVDRRGERADLYTADGSWHLSGAINSANATTTLDTFSKISVGSYADIGLSRVRRVANRTVDGVEGYVVRGTGRGIFIYEFGAIRGDAVVQFKFEFPADSPKARPWVKSVLASVEWK